MRSIVLKAVGRCQCFRETCCSHLQDKVSVPLLPSFLYFTDFFVSVYLLLTHLSSYSFHFCPFTFAVKTALLLGPLTPVLVSLNISLTVTIDIYSYFLFHLISPFLCYHFSSSEGLSFFPLGINFRKQLLLGLTGFCCSLYHPGPSLPFPTSVLFFPHHTCIHLP